MGIKKTVLLLIATFLSLSIQAQEVVDHVVVKGNTVYSIARQYKASVSAIAQENPGVLDSALSLGDTLHIPLPAVVQKDTATFFYHTVKAFETLYGISKEYGTSDSLIIAANNLQGTSIKRGQEIRIPKDDDFDLAQYESRAARGDAPDTTSVPTEVKPFVLYTVVAGDSIPGLCTAWNLSKRAFYKLNPEAKNNWYVGMPLVRPNTDSSAHHAATMAWGGGDSLRVVLPLPVYAKAYAKGEKIGERIKLAAQFYTGVQKAAMDFEAQYGIPVAIEVVDIQGGDTIPAVANELAKRSELDLVMGPVFANNVLKFQQHYGSENVVSPLTKSEKLKGCGVWNTAVYHQAQISATMDLLNSYDSLAVDTISDRHLLLFVKDSPAERKRVDTFVKGLHGWEVKVYYNDEKWSQNEAVQWLDTTVYYHVLSLDKDPAFALDAIRNLRATSLNYKWIVLESQHSAKGMGPEVLGREDVLACFTQYFDPLDASNLDFVAEYRAQYGMEPSKYAIRGYDNTMFHLMRLAGHSLERGIVLGFDFSTGKENSYCEWRVLVDLNWQLLGGPATL